LLTEYSEYLKHNGTNDDDDVDLVSIKNSLEQKLAVVVANIPGQITLKSAPKRAATCWEMFQSSLTGWPLIRSGAESFSQLVVSSTVKNDFNDKKELSRMKG
jgi:hypothetical protein